jgi:hypothetical protein
MLQEEKVLVLLQSLEAHLAAFLTYGGEWVSDIPKLSPYMHLSVAC